MAHTGTRGGNGSAGGNGATPPRAWDVAGTVGGPVILFLHGTRVTRHMWHPQVRAFANDYRMVSVDLPAHGVLKDIPFRMTLAKDHIRRTIDEACGGRAILVGQSLGGYLAMLVAAEDPEAVEGLVLTNCSAEPRTIARRAARTIGGYLVGATRQRIRGHVPGPEAWPAGEPHHEQAVVEFEPATRGVLFRGSSRALASALRMRFLTRLAAYPGPTLILNGELDEVFRRSELEFLAACRHGRLAVVPGSGHICNIEGAEVYNAALRGFIDDIRAGRTIGDAPTATDDGANPAPVSEPAAPSEQLVGA